KYLAIHPPWAKPPSVSSVGAPGAWTTPSRLMNSVMGVLMGSPACGAPRLGFQELLQSCEHHRPVPFGMLARSFGRVVVLGQRDMGLVPRTGQLDRHGVMVLRFIR